jgi:hypothetical protein
MQTYPKSTALGTLGLPSGVHWVRLHVEDDAISAEIAASMVLESKPSGSEKPTGFVQRWGGSSRKLECRGYEPRTSVTN